MLLGRFATWLAAGLTWTLLSCSAKEVQPNYFRSTTLVVFGLLVLAGLACWGNLGVLGLAVTGASVATSYIAFVGWSAERPPVAQGALAVQSGLLLVALAQHAQMSAAGLTPFSLLDASASSLLVGAGMGAMLLGHSYLTTPWMSLRPLYRMLILIVLACGLRIVVGAVSYFGSTGAPASVGADDALVFVLRWILGVGGPLLLAFLTWKTLAWKNTQAATGILYVVVIFTLIGEATALAVGRLAGAPL